MKNFRLKGPGISLLSIIIITLLNLILFLYIFYWLQNESLKDAQSKAQLSSKEIIHKIELYFRDALTINKTYTNNFLLYKRLKIPRDDVYSLVKGSITQNESFLAIWTMWEPNAYDNSDKRFAGDSIHDSKGSFAIAYYYDKNEIKQEINDTLDYFEDFYTIPSKIKKPIILDPFHYQYHGNPKVYYETSLVSPILEDNKFIGVIGIDIDLQMLQDSFKNIKVFNHGFISILSNSGHIVTHPNDTIIDSNISKYLSEQNMAIIDSLKSGQEFSKNNYSEFSGKKVIRFFYPINMEYMVAPWYIMVEIPEDEIYSYVDKLKILSVFIFIIIWGLTIYLIINIYKKDKAEEELKDSEVFNKLLFQDSYIPIVVLEPETGKFIDCNEAAVKIYGFANKEETLGKTPIDVSSEFQEDGLSSVEAKIRIDKAVNEGFVFFEWRHQRPNGEIWEADVHLMEFEYKGKKLLQFTLHDITERKKVQNELKDSEQQYRTLFENANDAIFVMKGNKFIDCNLKTLTMFGCKREEIIGCEPYIFSPELQSDGSSSIEKAKFYISEALQGKPQFFEWRHKKLNGELFDAEVSLNILSIKNTHYLLALVRDITERKKAAQKLIESEARYRFISENTEDVIWVYSFIHNKFTFVSPSVIKLRGYTPEEVMDQTMSQALTPESYIKVQQLITERIKGKKQTDKTSIIFTNIIEQPCKDGTIVTTEVSTTTIFGKNGLPTEVVGVSRDITERIKTEAELAGYRNHLEELVDERTKEIAVLNEELTQSNEELQALNENLYNQKEELTNTLEKLKEMQEQLIQSEKMASIGILTAGVAHEINNPLNFIQSGLFSLESIVENLKPPLVESGNYDNIQKIFSHMNIGISRVSEIVTSLGRFSRKSNDLNQICNIHSIIDNCLVILNNVLKHKCTVEKNYFNQEIQVYGNEGKLHQVFINIINNSVQSIESDGKIKIITDKTNNKVLVSIVDNGKGIAPEHVNKIFDPFFTTKEPGKGTGLGLSIVYSIVKDHNGTISFNSKLNKGTEVIIQLPLKSDG